MRLFSKADVGGIVNGLEPCPSNSDLMEYLQRKVRNDQAVQIMREHVFDTKSQPPSSQDPRSLPERPSKSFRNFQGRTALDRLYCVYEHGTTLCAHIAKLYRLRDRYENVRPPIAGIRFRGYKLS